MHASPDTGRGAGDGAGAPALGRPRLLLSVLSGVLVVVAFPRLGVRYEMDHLVWVALVPLFLAAQGVGWRRGFGTGWLMGVTIEGVGFLWMLHSIRTFTGLGAVLASLGFLLWVLYSTVPWALLGAFVGRARRPIAVVWVLPLWVGIEHFYPRIWPWHLGGALYGRGAFLQAVDVVGASGLTALVFLVSSALFVAMRRVSARKRLPWGLVSFAAVAVAATVVYGTLRGSQLADAEADAPRLRVGFVQGCLTPSERHERPAEALRTYLDETDRLLQAEPALDLVVWPEGVDGFPFVLEPVGQTWYFHEHRSKGAPELAARLRRVPVPIVFGGAAAEFDASGAVARGFNVSVYLRPGEAPRFYKKNYRVPFGEVNPFLDLLPPVMRRQLGYTGNISAGSENPPLPLGEYVFRNLACYEAVLPGYVRRSATGSDFLVNITEDYWYGHTSHPSQHASVLVLRAVESRVPIVRATNVGPSGTVSLTGAFHSPAGVFVPARFACDVSVARATSPYATWGRWFPLACVVVGAWAQLGPGRLARRSRPTRRRPKR